MYPTATHGVAGSSSSMPCTVTGHVSDWVEDELRHVRGTATTRAEQCESAGERRQVRGLECQRHLTSVEGRRSGTAAGAAGSADEGGRRGRLSFLTTQDTPPG